MGVRHLITFLRPYSTLESIAGQQIVIDGPAFAHHIYYICLKGTKSAQNALEAAPSYSVLVKTALLWLEGLQDSNAVMHVFRVRPTYTANGLSARKYIGTDTFRLRNTILE